MLITNLLYIQDLSFYKRNNNLKSHIDKKYTHILIKVNKVRKSDIIDNIKLIVKYEYFSSGQRPHPDKAQNQPPNLPHKRNVKYRKSNFSHNNMAPRKISQFFFFTSRL